MDDQELVNQQRQVLGTLKRRLIVLEGQAAYFGSKADAHILMEIDDIRVQIEQVNRKLINNKKGLFLDFIHKLILSGYHSENVWEYKTTLLFFRDMINNFSESKLIDEIDFYAVKKGDNIYRHLLAIVKSDSLEDYEIYSIYK